MFRHTTHATHKLMMIALLLALFAAPFMLEASKISVLDSRALLAGGGVIGSSAFESAEVAPSTDNTARMSTAAGTGFTGVLTR